MIFLTGECLLAAGDDTPRCYCNHGFTGSDCGPCSENIVGDNCERCRDNYIGYNTTCDKLCVHGYATVYGRNSLQNSLSLADVI